MSANIDRFSQTRASVPIAGLIDGYRWTRVGRARVGLAALSSRLALGLGGPLGLNHGLNIKQPHSGQELEQDQTHKHAAETRRAVLAFAHAFAYCGTYRPAGSWRLGPVGVLLCGCGRLCGGGFPLAGLLSLLLGESAHTLEKELLLSLACTLLFVIAAARVVFYRRHRTK